MKRRWPLWTLLAVSLHALPLLLLRKLIGDLPAPLPARDSATDLEVELEVATGQSAASDRADREPAAAPAPERAEALARTSRTTPSDREDEKASAIERLTPPEPAAVGEAPAAQGLSLDELGLGERNPFVGSDLSRANPRPPAERPSAKARLERSLADAQLRADHARSLGPAGPVLSAMIKTTRNGETPANSSALFECVADASGKLVSVELAESDSDPTPWRRIARRVLASLASQLLRLPKTGQGAAFRIRVTSRQVLPSGADPGLEVSVLGIPVQRGDGERSSRIEILNPIPKLSVSTVTLPSGQTLDLPTLSMGNVLGIFGDPVDIGAPAQRVVHAHVESMSASE